MTFKKLAGYFDRLERTSSRLKMTEILAEVFREAADEEIDKICYLSLGRLVPLYQSLEFNLAEKMVVRAVAEAFGRERKEVMEAFKKKGDLGIVAHKLKVKSAKFKVASQNSRLTVLEVYRRLRQIAEDSGIGSQSRKIKGVAELLKALDGPSCKYVARVVVGKLRLGFSDKTMIDGLSWMIKGDKSLRDKIERAYFVRADIGELARRVKRAKFKIEGELKKIKPEVGVPIMPALCQRLKTADEMIAKMGKVAVEPKWDGTRVMIHIRGKDLLRTFTRNLDETTQMFPELKSAYKQVKAKSVILDSEAVGVDPRTKKLLSFQETIVRKRKYGVAETSRRVPLKFFVFDVLYKDGRSLLGEPLYKRREILGQILGDSGPLQLTEEIVTDDPGELRRYHQQQLKKGLEGAVVKKWSDAYVPGRRGYSWVKFKEEEKARGGLSDTLDCVVMGYYRGKGKRVKFGMGAFLVGVRKGEKLVTVAKIGTGLTDAQWRQMKLKIENEKLKINNKLKEYVVDKSLLPDVWLEPKIVVEIAADNITRSPNHSAKLALRFPRLVRFRDEKRSGQATSLKEMKRML